MVTDDSITDADFHVTTVPMVMFGGAHHDDSPITSMLRKVDSLVLGRKRSQLMTKMCLKWSMLKLGKFAHPLKSPRVGEVRPELVKMETDLMLAVTTMLP